MLEILDIRRRGSVLAIHIAKTKAPISFAITAKLIFAFVLAYADCLFSHAAAHFNNCLEIMLTDGSYTPDIAKYSRMCRKVKQREYRYKQQKYYAELLKEILMSRQVCGNFQVFNNLINVRSNYLIAF